MSKNINVNPGQYKVAGRERQGEDINSQQEKAKLNRSIKSNRRKKPAAQAKRKS